MMERVSVLPLPQRDPQLLRADAEETEKVIPEQCLPKAVVA